MPGQMRGTQYPKTVMDNPKLALHGEPWIENDYKNKPSLKVRVCGNSVWFTCYLSNPAEDDGIGPVNVKMDPKIVYTFLAMVQDCINDPEHRTAGIMNKGYVFSGGGQKSDKPKPMGTAYVSRNSSGEICLIIEHPGRTTSVYPFQATFWYNLIDKNGEPLSKAKTSGYVAQGWLDMLKGLLGNVVVNQYEHKEHTSFDNKQRGGSNNNNSGNGGGGNGGGYNNDRGGSNNGGGSHQPDSSQTNVFDSMS